VGLFLRRRDLDGVRLVKTENLLHRTHVEEIKVLIDFLLVVGLLLLLLLLG
jgi:hypothetical protein